MNVNVSDRQADIMIMSAGLAGLSAALILMSDGDKAFAWFIVR